MADLSLREQLNASYKLWNFLQELQNDLDRETSNLQELEAQKQDAQDRLDEMDQQKAKLKDMLNDVRQKCQEETQVVSLFILDLLKSNMSPVEGNSIYLMNKLSVFLSFYDKQQFPHKCRGPRKDFALLDTFHNGHKWKVKPNGLQGSLSTGIVVFYFFVGAFIQPNEAVEDQ